MGSICKGIKLNMRLSMHSPMRDMHRMSSMSATVKSTAMEASGGDVETATEGWPAVEGEAPYGAAAIEAVVVAVSHGHWPVPRTATVSARVGERCVRVVEAVTVREHPSVGNVGVMVEHHAAAAPIGAPMVPSPAKSRECRDPDAQAEQHLRLADEQPRLRDPTGIFSDRRTVDAPGIVLRHINGIGICRLNSDCRSLG